MTDPRRPQPRRNQRRPAVDTPSRAPNERLANLRLAHGWTQEELAVAVAQVLAERGIRTGIDADYISRLERGLISWPATDTRRALEALLEASAAEMGFVNRRLGGPQRRRDAPQSDAVSSAASVDDVTGRQPACSASGLRSASRLSEYGRAFQHRHGRLDGY